MAFSLSSFGGSGGSGSCYGSAYPYYSASYMATSYYEPYVTTASGTQVFEERAKKATEIIKQRKIEEQRKEHWWAKWTLADLSDYKKEEILKIIHQFLKEYQWRKEVKAMGTGIKWFFFLLGLALFFNMAKILKLIEMAVQCSK